MVESHSPHPETSKLLLTVAEASARTHIGRTRLYDLIASGVLESVTIGRSRRIPADALVTFVERLRSEQRVDGSEGGGCDG